MSDLLEGWLRWKLGVGRIKGRIGHNRYQGTGLADSRPVRAAAVQRQVKPVKRIEAYSDIMEGFIKEAADKSCDLIAFPEYNFLDILGVIPGFSALNNYLNEKAQKAAGKDNAGEGDIRRFYPLLNSIAEPVQTAMEAVMCGLAAKYNIHIYSGSYFIRENGKLYNGGAIISREGNILGRQKKLNLTDFEEKLGIKRADSLQVFSLDIGSFAFPVCMDATYYETFSLARLKGCDAVVLPISNNEEYGLFRALRGIWPRVQEAHVYGVKASLNGWFCGMHFTGKAGIFAPISMTAKGNGVVAASGSFEGDSLVVGDIDIDALRRERAADQYYGDGNTEFERDCCKYYFGG